MPDYVETNFDERSGIVPCAAPWGKWWQTIAEVHIEVSVPVGTRAKSIQVTVKPTSIRVVVLNQTIFEGPLYGVVRSDEAIWTLEDNKLLHIVLSKADACSKETIWEGLLKDDFLADPWTVHEMKTKLDLERFQIENPGFDFSGAQLKKGYDQVSKSSLERWEEKQKAMKEQDVLQDRERNVTSENEMGTSENVISEKRS
ncbi:NudC domain-containing protein 2 [Halocaridina rubra]|uniref:NudC domain-containing protein 2 n=1 Tax=Halocaridina rubra TaxID=373956 RepID=A0AAN8WIF6_HALRR